jgi:hypothetical protein
MKIKYETVDIRNIKGIRRAEMLHNRGWKVNSHSTTTIQFYIPIKKK